MLLGVIAQIVAVFLAIILICRLAVYFKFVKWDFKKALPEIVLFALLITAILGTRLVSSTYFKTSNFSQAFAAYTAYKRDNTFAYIDSSLMVNVVAPKTDDDEAGLKAAYKQKFENDITLTADADHSAYAYTATDGTTGLAYIYRYNKYDIYIFAPKIEEAA